VKKECRIEGEECASPNINYNNSVDILSTTTASFELKGNYNNGVDIPSNTN